MDNGDHFIVYADAVGETEQGVAGCFDPHNEAACGMLRVPEEETRKEAYDLLHVQVVGVAEGAVHVETQGADSGYVEGHAEIVI